MTETRAATAPMAFLADLENLWGCLDQLFASLAPGDWLCRHGQHWTFADVPYHLGYFDRDVVAYPIERGPDVPTAAQWAARSKSELNTWNERMFACRPLAQTVTQSLAQMQTSREALHRIIGQMPDRDLDRPAWFPLLVGGWVPVRTVLASCRLHTWGHVMELRLRHPVSIQSTLPVPHATTMHAALDDLMSFFPLILNRVQAEQICFTLTMVFSGPGGGSWTVRVANGACTVGEEQAARADMVLTQSPECFVKTWLELHDPVLAIRSGEITVQGADYLPIFAALFRHCGSDRKEALQH
jgi:DinB family protein